MGFSITIFICEVDGEKKFQYDLHIFIRCYESR